MPELLIVQPFFTAVGHPAQSVLNTARVLGRRQDTCYLISSGQRARELEPLVAQLASLGVVRQFKVPSSSLAFGTLLSLWPVARLARQQSQPFDVFFLDVHLPTLALLWPVLRPLARNVRAISALGLAGPELWSRRWWVRRLLARFLESGAVRLFLRTEELAAAWRSEYSGRRELRIDTLPSLEIPDDDESSAVPAPSGVLRFGIVGQVRPGKGIEWLVPLFTTHPELGKLEVVGAFFDEACRRQLPVLEGNPCFHNRFIPQHELLPLVASYDYILTLYDNWDSRLEAATFYLAARARRPVICYDAGWCGRMIREFGCGVAASSGEHPGASFFAGVPDRNSTAYAAMVEGMARFRAAHSGEIRRAEFLRKLTHANS